MKSTSFSINQTDPSNFLNFPYFPYETSTILSILLYNFEILQQKNKELIVQKTNRHSERRFIEGNQIIQMDGKILNHIFLFSISIFVLNFLKENEKTQIPLKKSNQKILERWIIILILFPFQQGWSWSGLILYPGPGHFSPLLQIQIVIAVLGIWLEIFSWKMLEILILCENLFLFGKVFHASLFRFYFHLQHSLSTRTGKFNLISQTRVLVK